MKRREAIRTSAALLGGACLGSAWLSGCSPGKHPELLAPEITTLLNQVAETIIPSTPGSPGAGVARMGEFMQVMVADCYDETRRKVFLDGVQDLVSKDFLSMSPLSQTDFLVQLEKEAIAFNAQKEENNPGHYFTLMKDLTVQGYFSSEEGATTALRHVPIPGRYDGCIDYIAGSPAWASQG